MDSPSEFFETDVTNCNENESYKTCKALATSVKIVYDLAESGVALIEEYNKFHSKHEKQKQFFKDGKPKHFFDRILFQKSTSLSS